MNANQRHGQRMPQMRWLRHVMERRGASVFAILTMVLLGLLGWVQLVPNIAIVLTVVLIIVFEFQRRLDQGVPLLQLTCLIAVLQWLVGPVLNYATSYNYGRYSMYVPEQEYFRFALPGTAFFVAIMLATGSSIKQKNLLAAVNRRQFVQVGIVLNVLGNVAAVAAAGRSGGSLGFLLFLISQFRYVGALYFICSKHQLRLVLAAASCLPLVSMSLEAGVFHDLILWLAIGFCYWFAQRRWNAAVKFLMLTVACVSLFSIQVIKQEYRERIQDGLNPSIMTLLTEYVTPGGKAWKNDTLSLAITRLNQGWIISAVMKNVPAVEPFANGETVEVAFVSALVPRLLWADKKKAGGQENFKRFTGLQIGKTTSMAISPLGEAYANFGENGGIVFMLIYGVFFALAYYGTLRYAARHPTFVFWIPFIFYQAIKAETELLVIINQLSKGAVIGFGMYYLIQSAFPTRRHGKELNQPHSPPSVVNLPPNPPLSSPH